MESVMVISISEEQDRLFEFGNFSVHLVRFQVWLEVREVVDGAFTVCRGNDMLRVLPDFIGNLMPRSFDGRDGVGKSAVLRGGVVV